MAAGIESVVFFRDIVTGKLPMLQKITSQWVTHTPSKEERALSEKRFQ